jgi:hypothetical protein
MTRTRLALLLTPLLLLAAAYAFRAPLAMRIAERGIERSLQSLSQRSRTGSRWRCAAPAAHCRTRSAPAPAWRCRQASFIW